MARGVWRKRFEQLASEFDAASDNGQRLLAVHRMLDASRRFGSVKMSSQVGAIVEAIAQEAV